MQSLFFFILAGILLFFILIDLLGHKLLKLKRGFLQWCLMICLIAGTAASGIIGASNLIQTHQQTEAGYYVAYQYLLDGNTQAAQKKINAAGRDSAGHSKVLSLLTECLNGDFISAYFTSEQILENENMSSELLESVKRLRELSYEELKGSSEPLSAKPTNTGTDLAADSKEEETSLTGDIQSEIHHCFDALDLSDGEKKKYDLVYQLDVILTAEDMTSVNERDIEDILLAYPEDEDVLKAAIRFYVQKNEFEQSQKYAQQLLDLNDSAANYVIYTDVIIHNAQNRQEPLEDKETQKLSQKASKLQKKLDKIDSDSPTEKEQKKIDKMTKELEELNRKIQYIDLYRSINYLNAKKPFFGDTTGMFDLQIAKLYLAADDRDSCKEYIYKVIDKAPAINENSPIKEPLEEVISAYNQSVAEESSPLLSSSVHNLIAAESQEIIPVADGTINGEFSNYITSTLKYDRIGIHIGKIDISEYPTVRAYANVNGEKEKVFGLVGDFTEKDFELIDTQYAIEDFKIISDPDAEQVHMSIVMDVSGSMAGTPLEDAKLAASDCITHMDSQKQKISLISYSSDASVITAETSQKSQLLSGIESLDSSGGTNISGAVTSAVNLLEGKSGTKAMILLTDGQDGNSPEAMQEAVTLAAQKDVVIFAVGFGDVNADYMRNIAEHTGGKFIKADNSTELSDIYLTLQKYIINNYCFEYTVTENPDDDPRNLMVNIPDYQVSDNKNYYLSEETEKEAQNSEGITLVGKDALSIASVTPGGASEKDISAGISVTVKGTGFQEGINVSIGGVALSDIKLKSATELTGKLKGSLTAGEYEVRASLPNRKVDIKNRLFVVFRAGTTRSVQIGTTKISADSIGQISDNTFVATGNVLINNFIHSNTSVRITADDLPENFSIESGTFQKLGSSGSISGDGKLYVSYAQASATDQTFANLVMGGKDYVVKNGEYTIKITQNSSDFDMTLADFDIEIPFICSTDVAEVNLHADRLQLDVKAVDLENIIRSVTEGVEQRVSHSDEANKEFWGEKTESFLDTQFSFAITADNIAVGGELTFNTDGLLDFKYFGIKNFGIKLNTLDGSQEYWKLSGGISLSKINKGFGEAEINGELSSYYWYPDHIQVSFDMDPGIPIEKIIHIKQIGAKVEGISNIFLKLDSSISNNSKNLLWTDLKAEDVKPKDIIVAGLVEADVNLFDTLNLPFPEDIKKWGELGSIKNGEFGIQFTNFKIYAKADLELLQQKVANAELSIGTEGFQAKGSLEATLSGFGLNIGGKISLGVDASPQVAGLELGISGNLDCSLTNTHLSGECSARVETAFDRLYLAIILKSGDTTTKYWYDSNGTVFFFDGFHAETTVSA